MTGGPPVSEHYSEARKAGWLSGYGNRPHDRALWPDVSDRDPEFTRGRKAGEIERRKTDARLRQAGVR